MTDSVFIDAIIDIAFKEDIGEGDHTSLACIASGNRGRMMMTAKQSGVISGIFIAEKIYQRFNEPVTMEFFAIEGDIVNPGDKIFISEGDIITLLKTERIILNFMQRMSGIATLTRKYVQKLEGLNTKLLDTRKTTPGMRVLEKMAVVSGGGVNHRMGLYDMILVKDNHIDFSGGLTNAIKNVHNYLNKLEKKLSIIVEARNLDDVSEILNAGGVNRILLDNFSVEETRKAVQLIDNKAETESSGNINLENIREYAECGVNYISVGALTHQYTSIDLSMTVIKD